jgi:formate hydrogenlyase subunit 3/multisubunit Na+/H+ antiporter MnhD subunit
MGGLAEKMPFTGTSSTVAALSLAGVPPFACFISEFFIFVGAFQMISSGDGFYMWPTILMLVATVLSLGYSLRFVSRVFMGQNKVEMNIVEKIRKLPAYMKLSMGILVVLVVVIGVWPTFFLNLINTARF